MVERSSSLTRAALRVQLKAEDVIYLKEELTSRFGGREPSLRDMIWGHLNRKGLEYAASRSWGLYRNTRLAMAGILYHDGKEAEALRLLLEVAVLDFNGATNAVTVNGRPAPPNPDYPDFDLRRAFAAPAVLSAIADLAEDEGLDRRALQDAFERQAARTAAGLKLPLTVDETWRQFSKALG